MDVLFKVSSPNFTLGLCTTFMMVSCQKVHRDGKACRQSGAESRRTRTKKQSESGEAVTSRTRYDYLMLAVVRESPVAEAYHFCENAITR